MPGDRKKEYKQSTGTVPKIKPYNVSSSPVSGEWSSTYANNITSYRHYTPDQHNLLSNRKGNHQNKYYTMESTVESYLPTVQNIIANETSSNTSSSNSRRNSSGSTLKCDNLTKYPDKNQVEQRLDQIREYLKITDSLMTSIRNTDEHTTDFSEIESLEKMTNDLKDSERKLVGILDLMSSEDGMNSEQADNAAAVQSFNSTASSNIRNDINLDDPNHQMDALKEQQLSLMQLQQKAEYKLRSARRIQSNLLQAASNNTNDSTTANACAPAPLKDVNNFDAAIADLEDRWKRLRPRRERPNNGEDAFTARIASLHDRMLGMRAANNEREHLIEALDEQDAALKSEHVELQSKLLELQTKKTQVDRLVAQLESFGEEEEGDVGGRKIDTMKDQLEKLKDMLEIVKTTENIMHDTNQSVEVQAAASDICSTAENFLDKRMQQQEPVSDGIAGIVSVFRNGSYDGNGSNFRSGSYDGNARSVSNDGNARSVSNDGNVNNFRSVSNDGNVNNYRSGSRDGTVPNLMSGSYDGNVNNFRSGSRDGNVPNFRTGSYDGNVNNFRSSSRDGTVPNFRSGSYDGNVNNFRSGSCDGNGRSVSGDGYVNNVVRYDNDTSSNGRSKQVNKKNRSDARRVDNGQLTGANPKTVVHSQLDARNDLDAIVGKHKASISNLNHDVGNDAKSELNYWPAATNQRPPTDCDSPIFSTDEDDGQDDVVNLYTELRDNCNVAPLPPVYYSPSNSSKRRSSGNASRNVSCVIPIDVTRNFRGVSVGTTGSREAAISNVDQEKQEVRKQLYMMKNLIDSLINRNWAEENITNSQPQQQQQNATVLRNNLAPEYAPNASAGALPWPAEANGHSNLNNDQGGYGVGGNASWQNEAAQEETVEQAQQTEFEDYINVLCQQLIEHREEIENLKSSFAQLHTKVDTSQIASNNYSLNNYSQNLPQPDTNNYSLNNYSQNLPQPDTNNYSLNNYSQNLPQPDTNNYSLNNYSQNLPQPDIRQNLLQSDNRQNLLQSDNRQNLMQPDIRQNQLQPDIRQNQLQPDIRQNLMQPDIRQNLMQPDIRQNQLQPDIRQNLMQPDNRQNLMQPDIRQNQLQPDIRQNQLQPDIRQNLLQPVIRQNQLQPDIRQNLLQSDNRYQSNVVAPDLKTNPVSTVYSLPNLNQYQPPVSNMNPTYVNDCNVQSGRLLDLNNANNSMHGVNNPTVNQALPNQLWNGQALNNQVAPGNRANNYWDNFRSYSRQNLLSTKNADVLQTPSASYDRSNVLIELSAAAPPPPPPKANADPNEWQQSVNGAVAAPPDVLNVNGVAPKTGAAGAPISSGAIPRVLTAFSTIEHQMIDALERDCNSGGELTQQRLQSFDAMNELRQNVIKEANNLISINANRPHHLIQLFRDLQRIENDAVMMQTIQAVQDIVLKPLPTAEERKEHEPDHFTMWQSTTPAKAEEVSERSPPARRKLIGFRNLVKDLKVVMNKSGNSMFNALLLGRLRQIIVNSVAFRKMAETPPEVEALTKQVELALSEFRGIKVGACRSRLIDSLHILFSRELHLDRSQRINRLAYENMNSAHEEPEALGQERTTDGTVQCAADEENDSDHDDDIIPCCSQHRSTCLENKMRNCPMCAAAAFEISSRYRAVLKDVRSFLNKYTNTYMDSEFLGSLKQVIVDSALANKLAKKRVIRAHFFHMIESVLDIFEGRRVVDVQNILIANLTETFSDELMFTPNDAPEQELPEQERPKQELPEQERPEQELPEQELPKQERPEQELPEQERPEQELPKQELPKQELPEQELPEQELPEQERPEQELPASTPENGRDNTNYGQECQLQEQQSIAADLNPQAVDNIQNGDLAEADQSRMIDGHIEDEEQEESEVEEDEEEEEEGAVGGVLDINQETESHQAMRKSPVEKEDSAASATEGLDEVPTRLPIVKSRSSTPSKGSKDAAGSYSDSDPF